MRDSAKAIALFINHDPEQLECFNKEFQSPLHLATQLNKVKNKFVSSYFLPHNRQSPIGIQ